MAITSTQLSVLRTWIAKHDPQCSVCGSKKLIPMDSLHILFENQARDGAMVGMTVASLSCNECGTLLHVNAKTIGLVK